MTREETLEAKCLELSQTVANLQTRCDRLCKLVLQARPYTPIAVQWRIADEIVEIDGRQA
jgi:hypothetical protein